MMAKYEIAYSCGHTETKALFGAYTDRERFIAWAGRSGVCSACAAANKAAQVDATEQEHGLPALSGSPKQIVWARTLRHKVMTAVLERIEGKSRSVPEDKRVAFDELRGRIMVGLAGQATARFWIDNQDALVDQVIERVLKA